MNNTETMEAINNSAYYYHAACPCCGHFFSRGNEEKIVYCHECGQRLHLRAFSREEIENARIDRMIDNGYY